FPVDPATEIPENDADPFKVRSPVGWAARTVFPSKLKMSDSGNDCAKLHRAAHQLCGRPMATSPSLRRRTSVCSFLNRLLKLRPVRLLKDLGLRRSGATPRSSAHSSRFSSVTYRLPPT